MQAGDSQRQAVDLGEWCDQCGKQHKEIRRLPHGKDPWSGASLLCHGCFLEAMKFRAEENKRGVAFDWDLKLRWEDLKIYDPT